MQRMLDIIWNNSGGEESFDDSDFQKNSASNDDSDESVDAHSSDKENDAQSSDD